MTPGGSTKRPRVAVTALKRQQIERAIELYLRECYRNETVARVSELADRLGANRPYLSHLVASVLGKSLGDALQERQLSYAAHLLGTTALRMHEIAAKAAFGTERTFFRAFKRSYGETPGAYRKKNNQMSVDDGRMSR